MAYDPFEVLTSTGNKKSQVTCEWYFQDDQNRWIKYGDLSSNKNPKFKTQITSDDIEKAYSKNPKNNFILKSPSCSYVLDFIKWTQVNTETGKERAIKRVPKSKLNKSNNNDGASNQGNEQYKWYFEDKDRNWIEFGDVRSANNTSFVTKENSDDIERAYQNSKTIPYRISSERYRYTLDFQKMKQTNEETEAVKSIKRIEASQAAKLKVKRNYGPTKVLQSTYPKYWKPMSGKSFITVTLSKNDAEYKKFDRMISSTLTVNIQKMVRIQNHHTWTAYINKVDQLKKKYPTINYKEEYLFHGTSSSHIDSISTDNLDVRMVVGCYYGQGTYFSNSASISAGYTSSNPRCMFIVKVLIGKTFVGNQSIRIPPGDSDTSVNNTSNPSQFVKFDRTEFYPEYYVLF